MLTQHYITPNWPAPKNVRAFATTRNGGFSESPFSSLSFNFKDNDNPDNLHKNCQKIMHDLQLPSEPIWLQQQHTNILVNATEIQNKFPIADASFTNEKNQVCVARTADCLPILICDRDATVVAAIHAGWKGIAQGIIENTIRTLNKDPKNILVWFGPAIGPTKFEVGRDVYDIFINQDPKAKTAFITTSTPEKWLANIYQLATLRLQNCEVTAIYGGDYCTYTQNDLFFSYRRDHHKTGHMASLIWVNEQ